MRRMFRVIDATGRELFKGTSTYIRRRLSTLARRGGLEGLTVQAGGYDPTAGEKEPPTWRHIAPAATWLIRNQQ